MIPFEKNLVSLGGGQQGKRSDVTIGFGGDGLEQGPVVAGHTLDRATIKKVGVVNEQTLQLLAPGENLEDEIIGRHGNLKLELFHSQAGNLRPFLGQILEIKYHLEKGGGYSERGPAVAPREVVQTADPGDCKPPGRPLAHAPAVPGRWDSRTD